MTDSKPGPAETVPVSVLVATIGRPALLRDLLSSIAACEPGPAEVVVVDQSGTDSVEEIAASLEIRHLRVIHDQGKGKPHAVNLGLRQLSNDVVLLTDDDCVVRSDWVGAAAAIMAANPTGIISGQVLAGGGDPAGVPSVIEENAPRDFTGELRCGVLYAGNMAFHRDELRDFGGFDEQMVPSAADCDLCYRWLRAGKRLRHVPELVVWHQDWRTPEELEAHYRRYYFGQGIFYAKHLIRRDPRILRFLIGDLFGWVRSLWGVARGRPRWRDQRRATVRGLAAGLQTGGRRFRNRS